MSVATEVEFGKIMKDVPCSHIRKVLGHEAALDLLRFISVTRDLQDSGSSVSGRLHR